MSEVIGYDVVRVWKQEKMFHAKRTRMGDALTPIDVEVLIIKKLRACGLRCIIHSSTEKGRTVRVSFDVKKI